MLEYYISCNIQTMDELYISSYTEKTIFKEFIVCGRIEIKHQLSISDTH